MNEKDDIVQILGAAIEARGLTSEESSSLIEVIRMLLEASEYYVTREQHEQELKQAGELVGYHLEIIEEYRRREKQCVIGGCLDNLTTQEVFLPVIDAKVYLCDDHRDRGIAESLDKKEA